MPLFYCFDSSITRRDATIHALTIFGNRVSFLQMYPHPDILNYSKLELAHSHSCWLCMYPLCRSCFRLDQVDGLLFFVFLKLIKFAIFCFYAAGCDGLWLWFVECGGCVHHFLDFEMESQCDLLEGSRKQMQVDGAGKFDPSSSEV